LFQQLCFDPVGIDTFPSGYSFRDPEHYGFGVLSDATLGCESDRAVGDALQPAPTLCVSNCTCMVVVLLHGLQRIGACGVCMSSTQCIDDFDIQGQALPRTPITTSKGPVD
jgi:hypothetical protein